MLIYPDIVHKNVTKSFGKAVWHYMPRSLNYSYSLIKHFRNFPGGSVVKNPPAKAGDMDSIPGPGTKIPHVSEQLNLCTTTAKACMSQSPCSATNRSHHNKKPAYHTQRAAPAHRIQRKPVDRNKDSVKPKNK